MNSLLLAIILIPALEIYLFIKIGGAIGALNTVLLIIITAIIGVYYARLEGLNTLNQGLKNTLRNQIPIYELISGAFIAIGAIFLIIPGFATDFLGFIIIFPPTRKLLLKRVRNKNEKKYSNDKDYIDGEYKDLDE